MNIYRIGMHLIPLGSWEGAEYCPVDGIGIGHLVVEESGVESKSTSIDTSLITEANSMDIHRIGMYPIPLECWEGIEHGPIDRVGIGHLVVEESGVESKSTSIDTSLITEGNSIDIYRVGTYPIPLESWEGARHGPIDRIGTECLVVEVSDVESKSIREVSSLNIYCTGTYLT